MPRCVFLFDLDGTLVDTAPDLAAAANALRTARGMAPLPYEALQPITGRGAPALVAAALGAKPSDPGFEALRREFLENYEHALAAESKVYPGTGTLLEALQESGARLGVVTNKQTAYAQTILSALGLAPFFSLVIGSDAPCAAMKPKPDSLLTAMKALGADAARTWYAGDDLGDVLAAHAAGIVCAFADWGVKRTIAEASGADFVARRPEAIFGWFLRSRSAHLGAVSGTAA